MQVMVDVTDEIRREAEQRGLPIIDFIDLLIARGLGVERQPVAVMSAIERIRALRTAQTAALVSAEPASKR